MTEKEQLRRQELSVNTALKVIGDAIDRRTLSPESITLGQALLVIAEAVKYLLIKEQGESNAS